MAGIAPPPIKPPRGIKQAPRETSGLLMSVIRTLSASESNEQRDREKAKLDIEFKKSDQKLDEYVSQHDEDLSKVLQVFEYLSTKVITSRDKIHTVKENLVACKMLLRCKREELKKLWLEGIEHKHVLSLLEEIDNLRDVPAQIDSHLSKKQYLDGTKLLVKSSKTIETSLDEIDALRDLKAELKTRKEQLHVTLTKDLFEQLYSVPSLQAANLRRQGSGIRGSGRTAWRYPPNTQINKVNTLTAEDTKNEKSNKDNKSEHYIALLVESLALLSKLPETLTSIKENMQKEITSIVNHTTSQLVSNRTKDSNLLIELLLTLFDQFKAVASAHSIALACFLKTSDMYRIRDIRLYEMADVWAKLQLVLQQILARYLDIPNTSTSSSRQPTQTFSESYDLSAYFSRRKPQRQKRSSLFKFDSSSHALTLTNYMKEQQGESYFPCANDMVCKPDPWNITFLYIHLSKFIDEIEEKSGRKGQSCSLRTFIADFMQDVFLGRQHLLLANKVDQVTRSSDAWRAVITMEERKQLNLLQPILITVYKVQQCVDELHQLMKLIPAYAEHFLAMACNMLRSYKETCQAAYRGIVQPDAEDKRILSASWLKDEDINRFLKSLPNWTDLQSQRLVQQQTGHYTSFEEESPAEMRQRNIREAEILSGNLGEGSITLHEIISDTLQLKSLAQLHESTEWFALYLKNLAESLPKISSPSHSLIDGDIPPLPVATVDALSMLSNEFEDLANTCLLVLHLEVRVQCFHYLMSRTNTVNDPDDLDPKVLQLSRELTRIDDALNSALQRSKAKYVFEGLGYLIAKILISSVQNSSRIDEDSISKICRNILSLQQTLASITMIRETGLDYARHYFELFYYTPEELLSSVMEKGPQFSELEYMNALQVLHKTRGDSLSINSYLQRLSDILGEVGVTV